MKYELLAVIPAQYSEAELPGVFSGIVAAVKESGATVASEEDKGKEKLAYSIGAAKFAHMFLVKFEAEPAMAKVLNEQLRLRSDLARYMLTRVIVRAPSKPRANVESFKREAVFAPVISATAAASVKKEEQVTLEDLDRKLEEILGKETV